MFYNVYFKKRKKNYFFEQFPTKAEAETYAGIEGTQMESVGGKFFVKACNKRKLKSVS